MTIVPNQRKQMMTLMFIYHNLRETTTVMVIQIFSVANFEQYRQDSIAELAVIIACHRSLAAAGEGSSAHFTLELCFQPCRLLRNYRWL